MKAEVEQLANDGEAFDQLAGVQMEHTCLAGQRSGDVAVAREPRQRACVEVHAAAVGDGDLAGAEDLFDQHDVSMCR